MNSIHDLVNCSPASLYQYNCIRASKIFHLFHQAVDLYDIVILYDEVEPIEYSEEDSHFFPSVSTILDLGVSNDVDDTGSHFLSTFSSFTALSLASMDINFYDCPCLEDDSTIFID